MVEVICSCCGAPIYPKEHSEMVKCNYCHNFTKLAMEDQSEDKNNQKAVDRDRMKQAHAYRYEGLFNEADEIYTELLRKNNRNYEAMWFQLLCKYGVVYEERGSRERVITCRRRCESIFTDEETYHTVCSHVTSEERIQYEKDGRYIANIQKKIAERKGKKPYDIFICYKETDANGGRSNDSYRAALLAHLLKTERYHVFFAPDTLKNHVGEDYEAEIFCAIESARIMIVLGTRKDYLESTWVKSEWMRFLDQMRTNKDKLLIPLYYDKHPERILPSKLQSLQGVNGTEDSYNNYENLMNKIRGILRNTQGTNTTKEFKESDLVHKGNALLLEGKTEEAIKCYEKAGKKQDAIAYYLLGSLYYTGDAIHHSMTVDLKKAFDYYQKAANLNYPQAMLQLGFMYEMGEGTPKGEADKGNAKTWYNKAKSHGLEVPDKL